MRRMDIKKRCDARTSEVNVEGVSWSEVDIIGWEYSGGLQGSTLILDSNDKSPDTNDPPREPRQGQALALVYQAGRFVGGRIANSMNSDALRIRVYEPVHIASEEDLLIIASQSVGMQRHICVKRAEGESRSLATAYHAMDPEAEALAGGPLFARYVPGAPEGASLQIGGDWREIRTLDGERMEAHSYLQIPVNEAVPTLEVQVLLDDFSEGKDVLATALIGISACAEWQDKSLEQIEALMRGALAYLSSQSSCRIIEAVITSRDGDLVRIDQPSG